MLKWQRLLVSSARNRKLKNNGSEAAWVASFLGSETMRSLILALAILATPFALAHELAEKHVHAKYFKNNVQGWTVITDKTKWCGGMNAFDGYAFSAAGDATRFCWVPRGDKVLVKFEGSNDTGMWPMDSFEDLEPELEPDVNVLFPENTKDL